MEKNLEFLETFTVEQFKRKEGVEKVEVKKNPHNSKLFFTYGSKVGAVAERGIPTHPMISYVKGEPTEKNPTGLFYILHEEGTGGAPTIAVF